MERRREGRDEELGMGNSISISMGYLSGSGSGSGPPMAMIHQESQAVKQLPLAPTILSTNPSDYHRIRSPNHPLIHPPRRGSAIFSPNSQTLIQPYNNPPPQRENPSPDPDPPPSSTKTMTAVSQQPETAGSGSGNNNPLIKYRECLKNHAASMGSHVVDGCGEFMPSGDAGTPAFFRCAACDCHRNFHRKEVEGNIPQSQPHPHHYPFNNPNPNPNPANISTAAAASTYSMPPHLRHRHKHSQQATQGSAPPAIVNFRGSSGGESSSEDLNMYQSGGAASNSKKRFRTIFRQDQKDRMQEFAAKLGWKIQKENEVEVQQFCNEVGVNRQIFKVWMHNNKQPIKKPHI